MNKDLLKENLTKAKNGDTDSILTIIDSFEKTVNLLSLKYSINGYEKEDLVQESNIAILNALDKIDLDSDKVNSNSYIISAITNNFYNLIKIKSKYNNEITLTAFNKDDSDFINSVPDNYSLEEDFISSINVASLHLALSKLSCDEFVLAKFIYYDNLPLSEYCRINNISYKSGRTKIKKLLSKLNLLLSNDN